ncbi:tetratricopeptide repeat protein, partial [Ostertagia ostertagi]
HNVCSGVKKLSILLENQVSTWVSVTAKGEDIAKYVDLRGPVPGIAGLQPICPSIDQREASPILGMHHLPAFALSDQFLFYKPEKALTDALKSLGNERDSIEHVAARLHTALLANGMGKNGEAVNWLLCVLSSLYWRVVGDAHRAVGCLQCALQTAPPHTRDVALVSLANICHQAGLLHSALIAAGTALSASPNLVAIHFTIANIYASMGDYQRALEFYYSTLSLQMNFEPAKERIRAIYCHSGKTFDFQAV